MRLTLTIENFSRRPDGGPLSYVAEGQRSVDIGRNQHLDWCLPDDKNFISGRHCEISPRDGAYFLTDVSTNGTYVDSWDNRVQSPYRLRNGDRLFIGDYIVVVSVEEDAPPPLQGSSATRPTPSYDDFWRPSGPVPPPIDPKSLHPRRLDPTPHVEWIDHVAEIPTPVAPTPRRPAAPAVDAASIWGPPPKSENPSLSSPPVTEAAADVWGVSPGRGEAPPTRDVIPASPAADVAWAAPPRSPPAPAVEPPAVPPAPNATDDSSHGSYADFLAAFSRALGVSEETFAPAGPREFGETLGALTRLIAEETRQLLRARAEAKRLTRSASHTIIEAQGNNPLKFAPTTEDALRIVFGPPRPGYLEAYAAFGQAFVDVKTHQLRTYAAMQEAVRMLSDGLDPAAIDKGFGKDSGLGALLGSRKARLWERYVERWQAMSPRASDRLADAFMKNFADCYDRADGQK